MLYLAKSIAGRKRLATASDLRDAWTITPYFRERGNFFDEADEMADREPEGCLSALIFRDIIPSSLAPVTMREIAEFVLRRSDERRQIREKINELAVALSSSESKDEAVAINRRFTAEIQGAREAFKKSSGFLSKHEVFALLTVGIPTTSAIYDLTRDYPAGGTLRLGVSVLLAERERSKLSSMKLPKLTAVIEREDDWFVATCPELGVASQGRTIEEAERMIKEAVEILLEDADDKEIERRLNRGVKVTSLEPAHA